MKIVETVKKYGKPIAGIVGGLAVAGVSAFAALNSRGLETDDDDDNVTTVDFGSETENDKEPEVAEDQPE